MEQERRSVKNASREGVKQEFSVVLAKRENRRTP